MISLTDCTNFKATWKTSQLFKTLLLSCVSLKKRIQLVLINEVL